MCLRRPQALRRTNEVTVRSLRKTVVSLKITSLPVRTKVLYGLNALLFIWFTYDHLRTIRLKYLVLIKQTLSSLVIG